MAIELKDYESGTPFAGDYDRTLADLQELVSRQLVSLSVHRRRAIIVAEGWDAAGKGGAIQRLTAQCDPRHYHVWPIAAPSEGEKARHYLWRFWTRLPKGGEVAIFDRSWYGRVLVERVEGFATEAEWRRAYDEINEFESQQAADGTLIVKLFFHVTQEVQDKRLAARLEDPWKRWKVTAEDFRNRARRPDYLAALADMFRETDTRWGAVDGDRRQQQEGRAHRRSQAVADALSAHVPRTRPRIVPKRNSWHSDCSSLR
jgi:polyphosphate kinase 2 (PPK2 family)